MSTRVLRVGGVEEPFNLPWIRAFETDSFAHLDLEVTFTEFAGGTGALVSAIEDRAVDLATLLTEGAVTAVARDRDVRMHSAFTESGLTWGIHVSAGSDLETVEDLEGKTFAISRFGSGSELMAYVFAADRGWTLTDEQFLVVGGVDGATEALPAGTADIFLWERFVTAPLVRKRIFKRVGDFPTPWPAFYTAGHPQLLANDGQLVDEVVQIVLNHAAELVANPESTIGEIVDRYGMSKSDTKSWLKRVAWPSAPTVDRDLLVSVMGTMADLGRIEAPIPVNQLLS